MVTVVSLDTFTNWLDGLKDRRAAARVASRILRVAQGNFGDRKSVGHSVSELRIDYGPGYRVYYTVREDGTLVILLGGGTKKRQSKDIEVAQKLASQLES
jgi:putative addiction module killer protein